MTKTSSSTGFQFSPPDPAVVLPTLAGSKAREPVAVQPGASAGGSVGETRPIPSLIALRGLVGLPDPAVMPDYSALQALVEAGAQPAAVPSQASTPLLPQAVKAVVPAELPATGTAAAPKKTRRRPPASAVALPLPREEPLEPPPVADGPIASDPMPESIAPDRVAQAVDAPVARFLDSTSDFLGIAKARFTGLRRLVDVPAASAPPFAGGMFDTGAGERMVLRKPAPVHDGMNDFIAGMLARVALADAPWVVPLSFHGDTWLASPQVSGAIDLNEYAQAAGPAAAAHRSAHLLASTSPPTTAARGIARRPDSHELTRRVVRAFEQCCGKGLEENVAFAMLVGADEQHSGHFVVVLHGERVERGDERPAEGDRRVSRVVRTDCTSASREHQRLHRIRSNYFDHQMHPAPTPRRLPGFGPNQHRVDVPRDLRCGAAYIEALLVLSRLDLSEAVRLAFLEAAHSWGDDVCRAFAVNANLRLPTRRWTREALFEECGRAYLQRIEARQKSMQRYAADLAIGLATVESQPPSHVLNLTRGPDGEVLIDAFLRQPETRPLIEAWLRREPGAARQRNLSLDRHDEALREAVAARLDAVDR